MHLYHQIYNTGQVNQFYDVTPSGYGAVPYSHGFFHNKLTPKPWGVRVPASAYSYLASAGGYMQYQVDTYKPVITGSVPLNNIVYDIYPNIIGYRNQYGAGPVSLIYDVVISGIKNRDDVSGCAFCDKYNREYSLHLSNGIGKYSSLDYIYNTNNIFFDTYWNVDNICNKNYRDNYCFNNYYYYNSNILTMGLVAVTGINNNSNEQDIYIIVHAPTHLYGYGADTNFWHSPDSIDVSTFVFAKKYGTFKFGVDPLFNYENRPNMIDNVWTKLEPLEENIFLYQYYNRNKKYITSNTNYTSYYRCDFSDAKCYIRPRNNGVSSHLLPTVNQSGLNFKNTSYNNIIGYNGFGGNSVSSSNNILYNNINLKFTNISDTGIRYGCISCNDYYSKDRQLRLKENTATIYYPAYIELDNIYNNTLISGLVPPVTGTQASYYSLSSREWYGGVPNSFKDIGSSMRNSLFVDIPKDHLRNLTNICEFGCMDETTPNTLYNNHTQNPCNNFFKLDWVVYNQYGTGVSYTWMESYLYIGQYSNRSSFFASTATLSPFRFKRTICDDRTEIPRRCREVKYVNNAPISGIASASGIVDDKYLFYNDNWTTDYYTNNNYFGDSSDIFDKNYQLHNITGYCNIHNYKPVVTDLPTDNILCEHKICCCICNGGLGVPRTLALTFNFPSIIDNITYLMTETKSYIQNPDIFYNLKYKSCEWKINYNNSRAYLSNNNIIYDVYVSGTRQSNYPCECNDNNQCFWGFTPSWQYPCTAFHAYGSIPLNFSNKNHINCSQSYSTNSGSWEFPCHVSGYFGSTWLCSVSGLVGGTVTADFLNLENASDYM